MQLSNQDNWKEQFDYIIKFIRWNYPRLRPIYADIPIVQIWQKREWQLRLCNIAWARRYSNYNECIHTSQIRRCQGRIGTAEGKRAVKKGAGIGGYGVCQERIKESKCSLETVSRKRGRSTSGKFYFHLYLFYLPR